VYLVDRDLAYAIECKKLVFRPPPKKFDQTSIDMHLDKIETAKIWDIDRFVKHNANAGRMRPELVLGRYNLGDFGKDYLCPPPAYSEDLKQQVGLRGQEVVVKTGGFLLWPTKEIVGTNPDKTADLICFVNGKSTKARTGVLVHFTAPTIHAGWNGVITLEIANLGPFDIVLREDDVICQLTVAKTTCAPSKDARVDSSTFGQTGVDGLAD
jgi:dCTP deaminase